MSDESIKLLLSVVPSAAALLLTARFMWQIQRAAIARYEHNLQALREDIVRLERENERLEARLSAERDVRRADNARCDRQIAELRRRLAQFSPPHGTPTTD
jgi:predicted RNase H-like nuclease (RuvC/YqgF family)